MKTITIGGHAYRLTLMMQGRYEVLDEKSGRVGEVIGKPGAWQATLRGGALTGKVSTLANAVDEIHQAELNRSR